MDKVKFGARLQEARKRKKLSARELSSLLGLSGGYIAQIEAGNRLPTITYLADICNILDVSPEYLMEADLTIGREGELAKLIARLHKLPAEDIHMIAKMTDAIYQDRK